MFFPIGDENPRRSFPLVTALLVTVNAAVFVLFQMTLDEQASQEFVLKWGYDARYPVSLQLFTSMFLHGGFMHLLGNMWVLAIVGDNVEDRLGKIGFLVFYLVAGAAAGLCYAFFAHLKGPDPRVLEEYGRPYAPALGASGAVYGVMGTYLVFFPWAKMKTVVFWMIVRIPAALFFGLMILLDVFQTISSMGPAVGGVATAAHAGGGVFGVVAALALKPVVGGGGEEGAPVLG